MKKFDDEFLELEIKYEKLRQPHLDERKKIINLTTDGKFDGIPSFWENVLKNSELAGELIQPHDYDSLKYLEDVTFTVDDSPKGFTIEFHYGENPYFKNKVLKKKFIEGEEGEDKGRIIKCTGTEIDWASDDKNLTKKIVYKKKKHKTGGKTKKVKSYEEQESFYQYFKELDKPEEDTEEAYIMESLLGSDSEIGQTIRESIIPNAIDYYLGKVEIENNMMGGGYGEDEDFDGEDEE